MTMTTNFKRFGTMLDCSRNAVVNVDSLKRWIDLTADLGCNTLMLYTEDTYEIPDQPYFGYLRGRYSQEELKEVDAYARERGIELIPCIQTLAHLATIKRWPAYEELFDIDDILLPEEEKVYDLIDGMFSSLAECFTSRIAHIGMDEAFHLGRGRYLDRHGIQDRFGIMMRHLRRVCEIGAKYGFRFLMWSDMFFRLAANIGDYDADVEISEEIKKQIPENVELVYWDYRAADKSYFAQVILAHEKMKPGTWFAGGLWKWVGFAPRNQYSMAAVDGSITSARDQKVENVFLTMWGDNGGECSPFAILPSLFYASELAKGNHNVESIKALFEEKYGVPFDVFLRLDMPGAPEGDHTRISTQERYLLYADCFLGQYDRNLNGHEAEQYTKITELLTDALEKESLGEWAYLFRSMRDLSAVLALKADLGVRTHEAYRNGREAVRELLPVYEEVSKRLETFYQTYKVQWFHDNKPFGFEIQDMRLGGLMNRVRSCHDIL